MSQDNIIRPGHTVEGNPRNNNNMQPVINYWHTRASNAADSDSDDDSFGELWRATISGNGISVGDGPVALTLEERLAPQTTYLENGELGLHSTERVIDLIGAFEPPRRHVLAHFDVMYGHMPLVVNFPSGYPGPDEDWEEDENEDEDEDIASGADGEAARAFCDGLQDVDKTVADAEPCPICFRLLSEDDGDSGSPVSMPCHSRHMYHVECIHTWLAEQPSCPSCRTGYPEIRGQTWPPFGGLPMRG